MTRPRYQTLNSAKAASCAEVLISKLAFAHAPYEHRASDKRTRYAFISRHDIKARRLSSDDKFKRKPISKFMRPCSRSGKFSLETMTLGRSTPWKPPFPGKIERLPGRSAVQNAVCCAILDMSFELAGGGRACDDQSVRGCPPHIPRGFLAGANRDLSCAADNHTRRAYFTKSECGQARMAVAAPGCFSVMAIAAC